MFLNRINNIEFGKASLAWICDIEYRVATHRQYTMERHVTRGNGHKKWFGVIGIISALIDSYRKSKAEAKRLQYLPGDFEIEPKYIIR